MCLAEWDFSYTLKSEHVATRLCTVYRFNYTDFGGAWADDSEHNAMLYVVMYEPCRLSPCRSTLNEIMSFSSSARSVVLPCLLQDLYTMDYYLETLWNTRCLQDYPINYYYWKLERNITKLKQTTITKFCVQKFCVQRSYTSAVKKLLRLRLLINYSWARSWARSWAELETQ